MDEMIYGEPLGPRVLSVFPTDDYELLLTFNNGEQRKFNAKPLLQMKAFEPLKDIHFFKNVWTAFGTVVWEGDIDYCPDTLYAQSVPFS